MQYEPINRGSNSAIIYFTTSSFFNGKYMFDVLVIRFARPSLDRNIEDLVSC